MVKGRKNANKEGCIRQLQDSRWEARLGYTDPITKKYQVYTHSAKTQKDVRNWLADIKAKIHTGQFVSKASITVKEWLNTWLYQYSKPKVRQTTWESYESVLRIHVLPKIGDELLQEIRPERLQRLYNEAFDKGRVDGKGGLSATTVNYIYAALNQAFKQAVKNQLLSRNIVELTDPPKEKRHEINPLTAEQVKTFLATAKGHILYPAFLLECHTGLRRGELLGLKWDDIDFENRRIYVKRSLNYTRIGFIFTETKTKASRRAIPLPPEVMEAFKLLKKQQAIERLQVGPAYDNNDLVFCNPLGKPLDPRNFVRKFEAVLKRAGLPKICFHDMRHTHATLLLALGENPKVVQERLGHTTVRMTLDTYSHVLPNMQQEATDRLSKVLSL